MNAENSRPAICICSLQIKLEDDSFVFIGSSSVSANSSMQVFDDADGMHEGDQHRGVDTKQLDNGIDQTLVPARVSGTTYPSLLLNFRLLLVLVAAVEPAVEN